MKKHEHSTWYRLADGTLADPNDVTTGRDGVMVAANGVPVAMRENGVPMTVGVELATSKNREAAEAGRAAERQEERAVKQEERQDARAEKQSERLAARDEKQAERQEQHTVKPVAESVPEKPVEAAKAVQPPVTAPPSAKEIVSEKPKAGYKNREMRTHKNRGSKTR